jgi:hypothetical protein
MRTDAGGVGQGGAAVPVGLPLLLLSVGAPPLSRPMRTDGAGASEGGAAVPVGLRLLLLSVGAPPLPRPMRADGVGAREGGTEAPVGLRVLPPVGAPPSPRAMRTDGAGAREGGAAAPVGLDLLLAVGAPPSPGPMRMDGAGARESGGAAPVGLRVFLDGGAGVPLRFFRVSPSRDSMVGGGATSGRGKLGVGGIPPCGAARTNPWARWVGGLREMAVVLKPKNNRHFTDSGRKRAIGDRQKLKKADGANRTQPEHNS